MTGRLDPDRAAAIAATVGAVAQLARACAETAAARGPGPDARAFQKQWADRAVGLLDALFPGIGDDVASGARLAQDLLAGAGVDLVAHAGDPFITSPLTPRPVTTTCGRCGTQLDGDGCCPEHGAIVAQLPPVGAMAAGVEPGPFD